MDNCELLKDIIIPIVASIIGGLFTVFGVYLTIKYEKQKDKEEKILSHKPLICRLDPMQQYDYKDTEDFQLTDCDMEEKGKIFGVIKNTDNAILLIEGVSVNGKLYKPVYGNVVDKNKIFNLYVHVNEKISKNDELIFIVKDIMENEYKYKLEINYDDKCSEIIGLKEIVKKARDK